MPNFTRFYFNPNGTAVTGFFQSFAPAGAYRFTEDLTGHQVEENAGRQPEPELPGCLPGAAARAPRTFFTNAEYEINDWIGVFAQGLFSRSGDQDGSAARHHR